MGGCLPGVLSETQVSNLSGHGLILVHTGRESIKIGPPLTIADAAIVEGVEVLGEAIAEAVALREAA